MKRDFNTWLSSMKDSIASWTYYTDFQKVYHKVNSIKIELNILNSLIGSKNIEEEFKQLAKDYPNILKVIPILLAKRESEIKITDATGLRVFNFRQLNCKIDEYAEFMRNTGLFDLMQNHVINNLVDYVSGVEFGMDTNARKNRTGKAMEDIVEGFLQKAGLVEDMTYFSQMSKTELKNKFGIDLSMIKEDIKDNGETAEKVFDFVFIGKDKTVYACECNFYASQGSKLNETARSYKEIALETKNVKGFQFVWFTDGIGWNTAKHNLEETFDLLDNIYNINDLKNGVIEVLCNL